MKILFEIDVHNKRVRFFIKYGELASWVKKATEDFPELNDEELGHRGGEFLTIVMTRAMQDVCEKNNVDGWEKFTPDFKLYKSKEELPIQLRH